MGVTSCLIAYPLVYRPIAGHSVRPWRITTASIAASIVALEIGAAEAQFIGIVDRLPHTVIMSTHDMELARRLCTRAILMDRGAIAYDGPIDTLPYPLISTL